MNGKMVDFVMSGGTHIWLEQGSAAGAAKTPTHFLG